MRRAASWPRRGALEVAAGVVNQHLPELEFVAIPIADRSVPDPATAFTRLRELAGRLEAGGHVVCHYRFGIRRASLLAAALLVLEGVDPEKVWRRLARARGQRVPDTEEQRRWIATLPTRLADRAWRRDDSRMQLRIEASDLPGRTCGSGDDFPGYTNIHVGVQRRERRDGG